MEMRCLAFLVNLWDTNVKVPPIGLVWIVCDIPDVFPMDLLVLHQIMI